MVQDDVSRCVTLLAKLVSEMRVTHRSLDRRAGWKSGTVSRALRHGREDIRLGQLLSILEALEISPLDFFTLVFRKEPLADRVYAHLSAAAAPLPPLTLPEPLSTSELEGLIKRALREVLKETEGESG
jgi:hypothetical protein